MAVLMARTNQGKKCAMYLWMTVGFAGIFMCIKAYEYSVDF